MYALGCGRYGAGREERGGGMIVWVRCVAALGLAEKEGIS